LPQYRKQKDENWRENAQRINKDFIRIWRVVVQPKYRGIGIATMLVKKSMPLTRFAHVETLAVMAKYSNFFDEAGMTRVDPSLYLNYDKRYITALERLASLGFDLEMLGSKSYNLKIVKKLPADNLEEAKRIASTYFIAEKFRKPTKKGFLDELESIAMILTARRLPYVYLIWKNANPRFAKSHTPTVHTSRMIA
jgi:predicted GNAT family acetyltransferase